MGSWPSELCPAAVLDANGHWWVVGDLICSCLVQGMTVEMGAPSSDFIASKHKPMVQKLKIEDKLAQVGPWPSPTQLPPP